MSPRKQPKSAARGAVAVESAIDRLREWMRTQLGVFTALDTDRNGRIDEVELDRAVSAAFQWFTKSTVPSTTWFYGDDSNWIGPVSWAEIRERGQRQKWLPVRLADETLWLPYAAIVEAGRLADSGSK